MSTQLIFSAITIIQNMGTHIGGFVFDGFMNIEHNSKLTITDHPVQLGAAISDHSYMEPQTVSFDIRMTDVAKDIINGQFGSNDGRSINAYQVLKNLQRARVPLIVGTRLQDYNNMLIADISAPDNFETRYGLKARVTLREVIIAEVQSFKISSRTDLTDYQNRGSVQPAAPDQSILYSMGQSGPELLRKFASEFTGVGQ